MRYRSASNTCLWRVHVGHESDTDTHVSDTDMQDLKEVFVIHRLQYK